MTGETRQVPPSTMLLARIASVRRKFVNTAAGTGVSMAVGALVILVGVGMLLDWWLDLPRAVRALLLVVELGAVGLLVWRFIYTPLSRQPEDDVVALMVEKARPEFRSRLIATLQLTRPGAIPPGAAPILVEALVGETETLATPVDFDSIIPTRELKKTSLWAAAVLGLGIFAFVGGGEVSVDLLKRAFLSSIEVPRKTRVTSLTGDVRIGRGDNVRIEASARGIIPSVGRVKVSTSGRREQEFTMEREKDKQDKFARVIENVQESFKYVVVLNDGSTKTHQVEVVPRPVVSSILCDQIYPAYTHLPNVLRSLGDLSLLAGSKLRLSVVANKEIKKAFVHLIGVTNDLPMQISTTNARALQAEIPIPARNLTGFSVNMTDRDDMAAPTNDAAIYRVEVVPDKAPSVKIIYPERKEELITRQATLIVAFEAVDDFQVGKARIRYKMGDSDTEEIKKIELDIGTNSLARVRNRYEWKMSTFTPSLTEGSRLEFWVEVEDNNDVTGPGVGVSDHHLARVVSETEKRADLLNRAGDFLGTIGDVTGDQEKINLNLGKIILDKPATK